MSETYADRRDPGGSDADLIDDLLANLPAGSLGIDIARSGLGLAADAVPEARLLQADMVSLPLADGTVDAVTAYHPVFHVARENHAAVYTGRQKS